MANLGENVKHL